MFFLFFFSSRRRHTRYIGDWSSDVCSSDLVFTVSRDFVRSIQTPLLIAPDDVPAHPYKVAMEVASLAPNAEVTIYPWKDSQEHIDEVVEHARSFLKAHEPVTARRQGRV